MDQGTVLSREQYEHFFLLSMDLACIASFDGFFKLLNLDWEKVLGYPLRELRSIHFIDLVHPDDLDRTLGASRELREGKTVHIDNRYRCADGSYKWLRWRARPVLLEKVIYAWASDITAEKQAEVQQDARETQLKAMLADLPVIAAFFRGADHVQEYSNSEYRKLVGDRDPIGKTPRELFSSIDEQILASMDRVFQSGERVVVRDRPIRADWKGDHLLTERFFTLMLEPSRSASGAVDGVWLVAIDLTGNKDLEVRLRISEWMASIGTLAAGVAHEINNPLGYTLANLSLVTEEMLETRSDLLIDKVPELVRMLKEADRGIQRVREISKALRVFSRNSDQKTELIEIPQVLESTLQMADNEIRSRATLVLEIGPTPPILGNPGKLAQALLNLVVNAAQAIEQGAAKRNCITLSTGTDLEGRAVIEVSDTGCGIAPQNLRRIFDPFFTSKPLGDGTGLGLFICHGIVTSMEGEIRVSSELGKGTQFQITLPPSNRCLIGVERGQTEGKASSRKKMKILVIDDEKPLGQVIRRILSRDHDVSVTDLPREGLRMVQNSPDFDVILCDLMMPEMSGMDVYKGLQAMGLGIERRMVFMTGGAFTSRSNHWLQNLPNARLEKPFDSKDLRDLISSLAA